LPANTSRCSYCGTRNDMDFVAVNRFAVSREESRRHCPDCKIPLQSVHLSLDGAFAIERCATCFGLFFDPGEVQAFLAASVNPVFEINYQAIGHVGRERFSRDRPIRYVPCPECGRVMNRVNFGFRSGVVMDQCKNHGVWLDSGEIIHLMEWKKAGGQLLDEEKKRQVQQERSRSQRPARGAVGGTPGGVDPFPDRSVDDLAQAAWSLLSRLFR
jgi:Zn-finger nucleic acid-binding protein